jgi:DMSO/TMAO reductase YedYZ molybdopterin-dependent catalytic subunit
MVFTPLHYFPSVISALLIIFLAGRVRAHKSLALIMASLAALGLVGYLSQGEFRFYPLDWHVLHSFFGIIALILTLTVFLDGMSFHKFRGQSHCRLGYIAAFFAILALSSGLYLLSGLAVLPQETPLSNGTSLSASEPSEPFLQQNASHILPEVETLQYQGKNLMPLSQQGNNAIKGSQVINKNAYRLAVTGLVETNLNMSYEELLKLPAYAEEVYMPCVEGWGFDAKWTGFRVADLLNISGLKPGASYAVFYSSDGYSTGLPLDYLSENKILLAYGINDVTLPPERGFPFQLVAKSRYGYKWAKWITRIEVVDKEERGYWESRGYSNSARVGELPFG